MSSLAKLINRDQIVEAIKYIDTNKPLLKWSKWKLKHDGKEYPPKEIVRIAAKIAGVPNWEQMTLRGGPNTNDPLIELGFEISAPPTSSDPLLELVSKYKFVLQKQKGLGDERYKWELLAKYRGRPNLDEPDLYQEFKDIAYRNLIYGPGIAVIHHLAKDRTEDYRGALRNLFSSNTPLINRIDTFVDKASDLYSQITPNPKYSHHHDERTIATLLTYYDPDNYSFYKNSFYEKLCKLIGIPSAPKNRKYVHYLNFIEGFIEECILPDSELTETYKGFLTEDLYQDSNLKLLAQDILYTNLDLALDEIEPDQSRIYKLSMSGNIPSSDVDACIAKNIVLVHEETKSKGLASISQGELFKNHVREGDYFYLTNGNQLGSIRLIGRFTGAARLTDYEGYKEEGWLERPFETIVFSGSKKKYKGPNKGWAPNNNSTFVEIKPAELDQANQFIFMPYFKTQFVIKNVNHLAAKQDIPMDIDNFPLNQILYGPPGTGKTYHTINKALQIVDPSFYKQHNGDRLKLKKRFSELVDEKRIVFTTFHQSLSYEDFIEGIKPETVDGKIEYRVKPGIFKELCMAARTPNQNDFNTAYGQFKKSLGENGRQKLLTPKGKEFEVGLNSNDNLTLYTGKERKAQGTLTKENIQLYTQSGQVNWTGWEGYFNGVVEHLKEHYGYSSEPKAGLNNFVLIIDEISRGEVSQIFGELITLIEESKREGQLEALSVKLPYSHQEQSFSVPDNVYLIGTMNTADRSVEALDIALRRRFSFEFMPSRPDLLVDDEKKEIEIEGLSLRKLLETINERITWLLDAEHEIGHSYLIHVRTPRELREAFAKNIVPLLKEYFFNDYGKIRMVLGDAFVKRKSGIQAKPKFAVSDGDFIPEAATFNIIAIDDQFDIIAALKKCVEPSTV